MNHAKSLTVSNNYLRNRSIMRTIGWRNDMTDRERVVQRLRKLIKAAHSENYDFVYIPVGTAKVIVRLLEDQQIQLKGKGGEPDGPA